jgi:DNA modification methylase
LSKLWAELLRITKSDAVFIFFATEPFRTFLINSNPSMFRYDLIWMKEKPTNCFLAKKRPLSCHESVLIFSKKKTMTYNAQLQPGDPYIKIKNAKTQGTNYNRDVHPTITTNNEGTRVPISILYYPRDHANQGLVSTQKPLGLIDNLILSFSNPDELICDPTFASGTTIVSTIKNNRNSIGFEINEQIFHIGERRIKNFRTTGKDEFWKIRENSIKPHLQTQLNQYYSATKTN